VVGASVFGRKGLFVEGGRRGPKTNGGGTNPFAANCGCLLLLLLLLLLQWSVWQTSAASCLLFSLPFFIFFVVFEVLGRSFEAPPLQVLNTETTTIRQKELRLLGGA
jgi:hypothetical protein